MKHKKTPQGYLVVLARGENVLETLTALCEQEKISSATITAIGAVERVKIGYYNLAKKEYFFRDEPGIFEVASLHGNVALVDGKPFIHAHAVLSRCDESLECIGAHIQEAFVAVTLEVVIVPFEGSVTRTLNEEIGLKLQDL